VLGGCGDAARVETEAHLFAEVPQQPRAVHVLHVRVRDVEVTILEQGERVLAPDHLRVSSRRRNDRGGRVRLERADDTLVTLRIVEGEVLRHDLAPSELAVDQHDRVADSAGLDLLDRRGRGQRRCDFARERVGSHEGLVTLPTRLQHGRSVLPLDTLERGAPDLEAERGHALGEHRGRRPVTGAAHMPVRM
jgi:hypothetical protein